MYLLPHAIAILLLKRAMSPIKTINWTKTTTIVKISYNEVGMCAIFIIVRKRVCPQGSKSYFNLAKYFLHM